jgi:hypothetical protein
VTKSKKKFYDIDTLLPKTVKCGGRRLFNGVELKQLLELALLLLWGTWVGIHNTSFSCNSQLGPIS